MKLFNDNETYTDDANYLSERVAELLRPVIDDYIEQGAKAREIAYIIEQEVACLTLAHILTRK